MKGYKYFNLLHARIDALEEFNELLIEALMKEHDKEWYKEAQEKMQQRFREDNKKYNPFYDGSPLERNKQEQEKWDFEEKGRRWIELDIQFQNNMKSNPLNKSAVIWFGEESPRIPKLDYENMEKQRQEFLQGIRQNMEKFKRQSSLWDRIKKWFI